MRNLKRIRKNGGFKKMFAMFQQTILENVLVWLSHGLPKCQISDSSSTSPENNEVILFVYISPPEIFISARDCNELTQ